MSKKCFRVKTRGLKGDCSAAGFFESIVKNVDSVEFERKTVPSSKPFAGCSFDYLVVDGISRFPSFDGGSAAGYGEIIEIDCESEEEVKVKFDCINNACIKSDKYETPGLYESLEECETVCGEKGCSGECISNKKWSQIKDLAGKLKDKNCK